MEFVHCGNLNERVKKLAQSLQLKVDREIYAGACRDPWEPLLGSRDLSPSVCFLGRDPGKDEIRLGEPLVGMSGKRVRRLLLKNRGLDSLDPKEASRHAFFSNIVPYKPIKNIVWPGPIRDRFRPLVLELLVDYWKGHRMISLGYESFVWLEGGGDSQEFAQAWKDPRCFVSSYSVKLQSARSGREKEIRLYPLPHPSPLNVKWFKRFPELLEARLNEVFR